jgi:hypothetical protein
MSGYLLINDIMSALSPRSFYCEAYPAGKQIALWSGGGPSGLEGGAGSGLALSRGIFLPRNELTILLLEEERIPQMS